MRPIGRGAQGEREAHDFNPELVGDRDCRGILLLLHIGRQPLASSTQWLRIWQFAGRIFGFFGFLTEP